MCAEVFIKHTHGLSDLRGKVREGGGGVGEKRPENLYAYLHNPWTQPTGGDRGRGQGQAIRGQWERKGDGCKTFNNKDLKTRLSERLFSLLPLPGTATLLVFPEE